MAYTLEQLVKQAETIAQGTLVWVGDDTLSIGIDWENEEMYIIDREHPDGAVNSSVWVSVNLTKADLPKNYVVDDEWAYPGSDKFSDWVQLFVTKQLEGEK